MTDKQPEALRLAGWLEDIGSPVELCEQVATELRRLHALNAELLQALDIVVVSIKVGPPEYDLNDTLEIAESALEAAKGKT